MKKITDNIEVLKSGKMSSQSDMENIHKKYDERDRIYGDDHNSSDERYNRGKIQADENSLIIRYVIIQMKTKIIIEMKLHMMKIKLSMIEKNKQLIIMKKYYLMMQNN